MLSKDSDVYRAAVAEAEKRGVSVEMVIESAVLLHGKLAVEKWLER